MSDFSGADNQPLAGRVEYEAECPGCGYSWTRRALDDRHATCPRCSKYWTHNVPGREREESKLFGGEADV